MVAFAGSASGRSDGWHMGWGMGQGWGFGHGLFGILWMVLFWGALIALIVFVVRKFSGSTGRSGTSERGSTPIDILKERFARGEIDKKEFEERRKILE
jgi:putative membrane protein